MQLNVCSALVWSRDVRCRKRSSTHRGRKVGRRGAVRARVAQRRRLLLRLLHHIRQAPSGHAAIVAAAARAHDGRGHDDLPLLEPLLDLALDALLLVLVERLALGRRGGDRGRHELLRGVGGRQPRLAGAQGGAEHDVLGLEVRVDDLKVPAGACAAEPAAPVTLTSMQQNIACAAPLQ